MSTAFSKPPEVVTNLLLSFLPVTVLSFDPSPTCSYAYQSEGALALPVGLPVLPCFLIQFLKGVHFESQLILFLSTFVAPPALSLGCFLDSFYHENINTSEK